LSVLRFWFSGNGIVCIWFTELKKESNIYVVKGLNLTSENDSLCAYWIRPLIVAQNRLGKRVVLLILGLCIAVPLSRLTDILSFDRNELKIMLSVVIWSRLEKPDQKWYHIILDKIETLYISYCLSVVDIHFICICGYLISDTWFLVNPRLKLNIALRNFISHYIVFKYFYRFWERLARQVRQRVGFFICIYYNTVSVLFCIPVG
jgi:hypothetical protein